jgi:hypothetical protein
MNKIQTVLIILIIISSSCKNKSHELIVNNSSVKFNVFPEEHEVTFNNLFEYKDGIPQEIHALDSNLVIRNKSKGAKYLLYNYSLNNNSLSKGYIEKGKGPFEAIGAAKSGTLKDKIWLYDMSSFKVIFLDKKRFILNNDNLLYKEYSLKNQSIEESYFYGSISFVDSLNFLGIHKWGSLSTSKIEKVDLSWKQEIKGYGQYAELSNKINLETIKYAHRASIYFNYKKNKALLAYGYTDLLEIYNVDSGNCIAIQGPENYNVYFTQEKGNHYFMGKTEDTKKTFVSGTFTDDFIYLIYSGHKRENRSESDRFKWQTGASIFVYDWKGNPVNKISLDRRINTIGVSNDNKSIYSYDLNTGYIIKAKL